MFCSTSPAPSTKLSKATWRRCSAASTIAWRTLLGLPVPAPPRGRNGACVRLEGLREGGLQGFPKAALQGFDSPPPLSAGVLCSEKALTTNVKMEALDLLEAVLGTHSIDSMEEVLQPCAQVRKAYFRQPRRVACTA